MSTVSGSIPDNWHRCVPNTGQRKFGFPSDQNIVQGAKTGKHLEVQHNCSKNFPDVVKYFNRQSEYKLVVDVHLESRGIHSLIAFRAQKSQNIFLDEGTCVLFIK